MQILKDQFTFESLLAIGATLSFLLYLAIGPTAFILAPLLLAVRTIDAILQTYGLRKNAHMDNILPGPKMSAQYPSADGTFGTTPAADQICVFMIGARNNHPLGALAPGVRELTSYFAEMNKELAKQAEEHGFLGAQHWVSDGQRPANNEVMTVIYFKSSDGLHKYAHGKLHREGWDWWNRTQAKHKHIGIWVVRICYKSRLYTLLTHSRVATSSGLYIGLVWGHVCRSRFKSVFMLQTRI
jgi:hypothetical protein